jgi:uncharacterized phage protein (TIGR02218 family)
MKTISSQLQSEIESGNICILSKITRTDGVIVAYTDHDRPLTVDGITYQAGAGVTRVSLSAKANQEVSSQSSESAWVQDISESEVERGVFDNAKVDFYWCSWRHPEYGTLLIFSGNVGIITWSQEGFVVDIQNTVKILDRAMGTIISPHCRHKLGSTGNINIPGLCGVNLTGYTFSGTVSSILTNRRKFILSGTASTKANAYFSSGTLHWTSGANNGFISDIKVHTVDSYGSNVEFYIPTIWDIQAGDTFTVIAGCDKTLGTCKDKFNNVINFGGFPHLQPETNYRQ